MKVKINDKVPFFMVGNISLNFENPIAEIDIASLQNNVKKVLYDAIGFKRIEVLEGNRDELLVGAPPSQRVVQQTPAPLPVVKKPVEEKAIQLEKEANPAEADKRIDSLLNGSVENIREVLKANRADGDFLRAVQSKEMVSKAPRKRIIKDIEAYLASLEEDALIKTRNEVKAVELYEKDIEANETKMEISDKGLEELQNVIVKAKTNKKRK